MGHKLEMLHLRPLASVSLPVTYCRRHAVFGSSLHHNVLKLCESSHQKFTKFITYRVPTGLENSWNFMLDLEFFCIISRFTLVLTL